MELWSVLLASIYLAAIVPAYGQGASKARFERSRKFVALGNSISAQNEDASINLLIDYETSLGGMGEQDLADWIAAGNRLRPVHARRIFDILLRSKSNHIIRQSLEWLGADYAYICKDQEVDLVKALSQRKDRQIALLASGVLGAIKRNEHFDKDLFPFVQ